MSDDYDTVDTLLLGRVTYDSFAGAWPAREAAGGDDAAFAKTLGDMRKLSRPGSRATSGGGTSS